MLKGWYYFQFKPYCLEKDYQLLRDDFLYCERLLRNLPEHLQRSMLRGYCAKWDEGMEQEQNEQRKQNAGRFLANTFLRECVESI
jgi:hypothetical protein